MDVVTVIKERRSIRRYKHEPLAPETVNELLEAARLAPSGTNLQPWRFKAVSSAEMRQKLADCTYNVGFLAQAPLVIVCCADLSALGTRGQRVRELQESGAFAGTDLENFSFDDYVKKVKRDDAANLAYLNLNVAIAIEHMILRGVELGLGSCWVMLFSQRKVKELLGLPDTLHVTALVPFGYPAQTPEARPRLSLSDIFLGEV